MPGAEALSIVPAQLSFLAIYNPLLGLTDETLIDQIVFYYKAGRLRQAESSLSEYTINEDKDDKNEQLRRIGLAQGIVNFAKDFSGGKPVDFLETEKSRVTIHEFEENWWIVASIDLTRLPTGVASGTTLPSDTPSIEYSSREVCPPQLLIQHLRKAHSIFLLHHDTSLDNLYQRVGRSTCCSLLDRFWTRFIQNWEVLLNGNPAVDIFNGVKLAAGGELGIGVGEEEWGSGEREVLEHFISRTDGLLDLVVSRFGDASKVKSASTGKKPTRKNSRLDQEGWLGLDRCPRPEDGVVFSGVGYISRSSLCQVSQWMEWIYRYGDAAYGVGESPSSIRRRRKDKRRATTPSIPYGSAPETDSKPALKTLRHYAQDSSTSRRIPPPIVTTCPPLGSKTHGNSQTDHNPINKGDDTYDSSGPFGAETLVKYLTLGYGSSWGIPLISSVPNERSSTSPRESDSNPYSPTLLSVIGVPSKTSRRFGIPSDEIAGRFIIGLRDDLEDGDGNDESMGSTSSKGNEGDEEYPNLKTMIRTLHIQMASSIYHEDGLLDDRYRKAQVLVYVHQPFIFTFLFELSTPSLASSSFYRSIHHQLGPLKKPLLSSTSPSNVFRRVSIGDSAASFQGRILLSNHPVHDLVYDPSNLTIRSSIPNIPEPVSFLLRDPDSLPWSRVEALNVHNQFLNTYIETRSRPLEVERTCKTSRGWWVVWVRVPGHLDDAHREAFLVRKAIDSATSSRHSRPTSGLRFFSDLSGVPTGISQQAPAANGYMGAGKPIEGLGFDTREYIESLLNLNR